MPAVSEKQRRFFGMVRAAQKRKGARSTGGIKAKSEVNRAARTMSSKQVREFASKVTPERKRAAVRRSMRRK